MIWRSTFSYSRLTSNSTSIVDPRACCTQHGRPGPYLAIKSIIKDQVFLFLCRSIVDFYSNAVLFNTPSKNNTFLENFWLIFLFNICYCNSGLAFKSKNYCIATKSCVYFLRENFKNLFQKFKWALWIRHQISILFDVKKA